MRIWLRPGLASWRAPGVDCARIRPFGPPSARSRHAPDFAEAPLRRRARRGGYAACSSCVADAARDSDIHRETPESRMRRRPSPRSTAYAAGAITYASAHHTCKDAAGRMTAESPSKTTLK